MADVVAPGAPMFFPTAHSFRTWLHENSGAVDELSVGFFKKDSGRQSITWPEAVDEALCVGWIDGVRKRIDAERYQIRFSRRKPGSTWSAINIERVAALTAEGRMTPSGSLAFLLRSEKRSRVYSYEQAETALLPAEMAARFRANERAWAFFSEQPPGFRNKLTWWVVSAKKSSTRESRFIKLIEASQSAKRL